MSFQTIRGILFLSNIQCVCHEVFIDRARVRGARIGDMELLLDLDEVESFHLAFRESANRLKNIADRMTRRML